VINIFSLAVPVPGLGKANENEISLVTPVVRKGTNLLE
jgi:hypothetical protein